MPPKAKSVASTLERFQTDAKMLPLAAEIKLREYAALYHQEAPQRRDERNLSFDPADAFLLRSAGFDVDDTLTMRQAFTRVANEANFAAIGGTVGDLANAQDAANQAVDHEKAELAKIDAELAALQARRYQITANTKRLQDGVEARKNAREALAKLLPPFAEQTIGVTAKRAMRAGESMAKINAMTRTMRDAYRELAASGPDWVERLADNPELDPAAAVALAPGAGS